MSSTLGQRRTRPQEVLSSPTRLCHIAIIGFQYSGNDSMSVFRFDGPTIEIAHLKTSGVNVAPISAAYPP